MTDVIIMRGLPGSGKSTWIEKHYPKAIVCSADHYHIQNGVYAFKLENQCQSHRACLRKYLNCLQRMMGGCGIEGPLIVDNTNTRAWEIAPYYTLAECLTATVKIVEIECPSDPHCRLAQSRNVHGVPREVWERMSKTIAGEVLPPHWIVERVALNSF